MKVNDVRALTQVQDPFGFTALEVTPVGSVDWIVVQNSDLDLFKLRYRHWVAEAKKVYDASIHVVISASTSKQPKNATNGLAHIRS